MASSPPSLPVEIDKWPEAARFAAYDCDHQRESKHSGTDERFRGATNAHPYRQRFLQGPRVDSLSSQGRPIFAGPMDVLIVTNLQKQIEFLCEKRVVVVQSQAEQGKCLDERPTAHNHLRPTLRQKIKGCEFLKNSNGVGGAQYRYSTGETYTLRTRGCSS